MASRLTAIGLFLVACSAGPGSSGTGTAPRIDSCRLAVAGGTVRLTVGYGSSRPPSDRVLLVASVRRPGGEELLRIHARRSGSTVLASGKEVGALGGWSYAPAAQGGGSLDLALPETEPGAWDLAGVRARVHVVGQIERGEGAIGLGAVDCDAVQ